MISIKSAHYAKSEVFFSLRRTRDYIIWLSSPRRKRPLLMRSGGGGARFLQFTFYTCFNLTYLPVCLVAIMLICIPGHVQCVICGGFYFFYVLHVSSTRPAVKTYIETGLKPLPFSLPAITIIVLGTVSRFSASIDIDPTKYPWIL